MATAHDPMVVSEALIRKINALPIARVAEIEDFVDFIAEREGGLALVAAARNASAPAFAAAWDNPEDDVYDAL